MKAVFTIVTPDYISYAKNLGDSLARYNPDYNFFVCLIGEESSLNSSVELSNFFFINLDELNDADAINSMRSRYNAFELSCALKPYFAEFILKNQLVTRLKYMDSDMMLFNSFDSVIEANVDSPVFLTPHFFMPVSPSEADTTNDAGLLKGGIYNAGYFEINNSEASFLFLEWWKSRLSNYSYFYKHPFEQINADQSWLNLVPIYFKNIFIIDHLGYNASFYNLHERRLSNIGGQYLINGKIPLIFFHFTGYKYYEHEKVSRHNPKFNYENTPFLESICNEYREALIENSIQLILPGNKNKTERKLSIASLKKVANYLLKTLFKIKIVKIGGAN